MFWGINTNGIDRTELKKNWRPNHNPRTGPNLDNMLSLEM